MNLFHTAFARLLDDQNTDELIATFQRAVAVYTKTNAEIYQHFSMSEEFITENRVRLMEHKTGEIEDNIRRMMVEAFHVAAVDAKIPDIEIDVMVSGGISWPNGRPQSQGLFEGAVEMFAMEFKITRDHNTVQWHRVIVCLRPYHGYQPIEEKLEWERSTFPTPEQSVTDEAPVLTLRAEDMKLMTTGNETIQDFAVLAIRAGWRTVQIFGTQLVLVK
ncbi:hypothetical protein pEaSNUABM8_00203 [Erwinia phage pEa_SNUABM_8]|nr:hypothetical protein pEaSNUABM8_00203 [Erwinia phage pEa_SNUABM_8]QVW54955.1 hypothetical protein pEaSNUABM4_00202 [Erwinia phage pEa_SNUABM_4]